MAPEDGTRASTMVTSAVERTVTHILPPLEGSPSPCSNSTMPFWQQTSPASNWQIPHCSRTAQQWGQWVRMGRTRHLDSGSLCHEPDSTTPFWGPTSPPANSRTHPRSCKDLLEQAAASVGRKCGGDCSTTAAWLRPKRSTGPQRSCTDRRVQQEQAAPWAAARMDASVAAAAAAWGAAWGAAWAAA